MPRITRAPKARPTNLIDTPRNRDHVHTKFTNPNIVFRHVLDRTALLVAMGNHVNNDNRGQLECAFQRDLKSHGSEHGHHQYGMTHTSQWTVLTGE